MTSQFSIPRIVLLSNDLASTHSIRKAVRGAGLTFSLEPVVNREQFLSRFRHGTVDLILAAARGLEGMEITEILEHANQNDVQIPIVIIGDDDERRVLESWNNVKVDFIRASQFDRLPVIIERILRGQRNRHVSNRLQSEFDRAAEILRENQKLIAIGRLTASIAHEINNPLESITNLLYLMEMDRGSTEKWEEYLHTAQRELNRVVQISKQTLTFSRETSVPMRVQPCDLIEEVLVLYGRKIADKNLRVVKQYESSEAVTVFPGEMRQVLSNLIANAIEATQPGGTLIFRIRPARNWSDQGVRGIRLSIADTGSGMSASVRRRLGEPFFTTKGQHGTGLGLWVTRSILNRYGGSLQLRSSVAAEHHGTVFSMFLPTNLRPHMVLPRANTAPIRINDATGKETTSGFQGDGTGSHGSKQLA